MYIAGFSQHLLAQVSERGVYLIEALTCSGEMLLLERQADLTPALEALKLEAGFWPSTFPLDFLHPNTIPLDFLPSTFSTPTLSNM